MSVFRNRRILFAAIFFAAAILLLLILTHTSNRSNPGGVTITLTGYTNGGDRPFVLLTLSNGDTVPIHSWDCLSELEGNGMLLEPTLNFSLPCLTNTQLHPGEAVVFAVGQPTDGGRWRVRFNYSRITRKLLIQQYLWQHRRWFPMNVFGVSQPQSDYRTNYSDWFEMRPPVKQK